MMSNEEIYWEEQEYNRAQEIMQKNVMEVTNAAGVNQGAIGGINNPKAIF